MAVTEKRFSELEKRVNNISESVAGLRGANSIPQKSPNTVLLAILSVLGVAVHLVLGMGRRSSCGPRQED